MQAHQIPQTKLIVVAHAPLASALLAVVQHVHGSVPPYVLAVDVAASDLPEATQRTIANFVQGSQALVLTDLPGATPHNCANHVCSQMQHAVMLSPVSAPLLLRAVNYSHLSARALHDKLIAG
jgi:PTS system ascorbate-specific IIA component